MSIFRRRDAWRKHPLFVSSLKDTFPGLGRAAKAFIAFVIVEESYKSLTKPSEAVPDLSKYEFVPNEERQGPPRMVKQHDDGGAVAHH